MNGLLQLGIVLTAIDKMSGVITGATDKAAQGFARLQQTVSQVSAKMTEMGTKASLMGHGIVNALQTPVAAFADLDEASTNLRVAMMDNLGRIPPQFAEINRQAVELGNVLPGTTADFVNNAQALLEKGASLSSVINGGLKAASYLGVILKIPQAEAGALTAKFRETFGLAEDELVKMADLTQRAKFSFGLAPDEIKYAAQYLGGTLNTLKLAGAENAKMVLAMQGLASQRGIEGSVFGTNFSMMLTQTAMLKDKLGRNSKIMKEVNSDLRHAGINLQFFDQAGNFVGLEKMVSELEKLNVLSQQDKLKVMTKLFQGEGARVASVLSDVGVAGLREAMALMDKQASIQQRIDETNKSARNTWEALTGTIENFWAAVGGPMVTALYPYMQAVNEFVGGPLMEWAERNKDLVKWLGLAALAVGGFLVVLGGVGIVAGAIASGFSVVCGVFAVVGGAIAALTWPVALVIGVLAAAATWIIANWSHVQALFKGFWLGFQSGLQPVMPLFRQVGQAIGWVGEKVGQLWNWFMGLLGPVEASTGKAASFGVAVGRAVGGIISWVVQANKAIFEFIAMPVKAVAAFVSAAHEMYKAGGSFIDMLWAGMKAAASKLYEGVKEIAATVRSFWPFSPAKAGPLRDLHRVRIIETIAEGVNAGPLVKAMTAAAGAGMAPVNKATVAAKATSLMGDAKWQDPRLQAILRRHGGMADPTPPAARAMPRNLGRTVPVGGAPAAPAPRPAAGAAASGRGRPGQGGGGGVTVNYTVNVKGGTDKDGLMAALKQHEHELVRLIEQVMARNARRAY